MSGVSVHHAGQYSTISADIGELRRIQLHVGVADKTGYADLLFAHGRLSTDVDTLRDIVLRGQEALAGRPVMPDCSGSVCRMDDDQ